MSEYQETKQLADKAAQFYKDMEGIAAFQKRDIVAILNTFVELEVRRTVEKKNKVKT